MLYGNKVDVLFVTENEFWLVEVKSELSSEGDMIRGCYQCIKYKAVLEAQICRILPNARVHAALVTRKPLVVGAKAVAEHHKIPHFLVKLNS